MKNFHKYKDTSKRIKDLFLQQIKEKKIEQIRISEICEILDINRTTFYRHYEDIYYLLKEIEKDFTDELELVYKDIASKRDDSLVVMEKILSFFNENRSICAVLFSRQNDLSLWKKYSDLTVDLFLYKIYQKYPDSTHVDQHELKQAVEFVSSGFYVLYRDWIMNDCKEEVDVLAKRLSSLSDGCIMNILKEQI